MYNCEFCVPQLIPVYDMATLRVCEMVMLAAYFVHNRAAVGAHYGAHYGGSECLLVFFMCLPVA